MLWSTVKVQRYGSVDTQIQQSAFERMTSAFGKERGSFIARLLAALSLFVFAAITFSQTVTLSTSTPIGTPSSSVNVPVRMPGGGTIASVHVRTGGVENLDFALAGAGDCSTQTPYFVNKVCNFPVVFKPKYPGQRVGAVILLDSGNNVLGSTNVVGTGLGPLSLFVPGTIQTVAGDASWIFHPGDDGIPATTSPIYLPYGITVDGAGNLFIADGNNNRIRRVDAGSQTITTVVGNGNPGASGDGGLATLASISLPSAVAIDATGNIYFADSGNHVIRRVDAFTGIITTAAGKIGVDGYGGDGGPGTQALLNSPSGVALDASGHLYIADTLNNVVRRLDLSTGILSAFAGNHRALYSGDGGPALSASLNGPWSMTVAASGNVYIADQSNHCVRKVDASGTITTIAGSGRPGFSGDNANATGSVLNSPSSVAVDVAGNLYISDSGNNRVRKINAVTGVIQTVIGSGDETFQGDGQAADTAGLYGPYGLVLDGAGDLFIADVFHNRVRMVSSNTTTLYYTSIRANKVSSPQSTTLENDGNAPLHFTSIQGVTNAQVDVPTTICSSGAAVNVSLTCTIGADFAPTSVGDPIFGSISITSDSPNSAQTITLEGPATRLDTTIAGLTSSGSPSAYGAPVVLTATLATTGTSLPTGTVTFLDGSSTIGTGVLDNTGIARLSVSTLSLGSHSLSVSYPGDTNNEPSVSPAITQLVKNGTTVRLSAAPVTSTYNQSVIFTAVAVGINAVPTGTMTFLDGATPLGTVTLDNTGSASFSTNTLAVGTHQISASYSGDTVAIGNVSNILTEIVGKSSSSVVLTTSNATSTFSSTITLKAIATSQSGLTPTGSVVFSDGSSVLQTVPLDTTGIATFPISTLAVGPHTLTATYSGDTNNTATISLPLSQAVTTIGTTTLLASNLSPVPAGGTVRLTATVTGALNPAGSPLTGSVSFTDGSVTLGTATLTSGVAYIDISSPSIGQHSIIATYNGATDYATSASVALSLNVQLATTTSTLAASPTPGIAGKAVVLTSSVTGNGGTPTGLVIFKDGGVSLGQGTVNASGIATLTIATLGPGSHMLTASYGGDQNDQVSAASLNFTIQQAATTTGLSSSGSPAVFGLPLTLSAIVSGTGGTPGGTVTFYEGTSLLGASQLDSTGKAVLALTSLTVGTHTLSAVYAGDLNDGTSTSAPWSQIIQKTTTNTALTTSAAATAQGSPVLFTAQVSSNAGTPGGTVQFFDGTTLLGTATLSQAGVATFSTSSLVPGQHNITAVFPGDLSNGASTSSSLAQLVNPVTIVGLTATPNPASTGGTVTLTAGVSGAHTIPTGLVTFSDGNAILGTGTLNVAGVATLSTTTLTSGAHPIKASYAGDANNAGGVSAVTTLQINQATTQTVLTLGSNTAGLGAPVTILASVTGTGGIPGGTVSFLDGSTVIGTATLSASGAASFTTATLTIGAHSLTAAYAGDTNDGSSTSTPSVLTVAKQSTQLVIDTANNPALGGTAVSFTAALRVVSGTPTGSIVWSDGSTVLASTPVSGSGTATFTTLLLAPGQAHTITAAYSGDTTFQTANSNAISETINQGTSAVALTTANPSVSAGTAVVLSISVTGTGAQPGGSVILSDNGVQIGTATLDGNGNSTFVSSTLSVGDHTLTAAYPGDVNHTRSQSTTVAEHISANTSAITLTSSKNPATAGDVVAFSVAVTGSGPQPGGTVQMTDGSLPLGPKLTLDSNGLASYTPSTPLSAGLHSLTAVYSPDAFHTGSSANLSETITQATSTTTLASSKNPALAGDVIVLSVAVSGGGSQVTGTVQFTDGGNPLGTAKLPLDGSGLASLTLTTPLSPGSHNLLATYGGDTNHSGSSSAVTQTVAQTSTVTTITSGSNPANTGAAVTFTIAVANAAAGPSGVPTGTVTVSDGTAVIASALTLNAGQASFTTSNLVVGQHTLTAVYIGDTNHTGSQSALLQTIQQATTLVLSSNQNPAIVGSAVLLTVSTSGFASSSPTVVTIHDGAATLATIGLDASGTASFSTTTLAVGSHILTAQFAGDATHLSSQSAALTQVVGQLSTSISLVSSKNPALVGDALTWSAVVSSTGSAPGGTLLLNDGTATIGSAMLDANGAAQFRSSTLITGTHNLVAVYAGDTTHLPSNSAPLSEVVQQVTQTSLSSGKNPSNSGSAVIFTAAVTATGNLPVTGKVTFLDGATVLGTAPINAAGLAALTVPQMSPGQHSISATYSGDTLNQASSSSAVNEQINSELTTTTLAGSGSPSFVTAAVTLTAQVTGGNLTPTGTVNFLDGSVVLGTGTVSAGGVATLTTTVLHAGSHVLLAIYQGDADHANSTSNPVQELVQQQTVVTLTSGLNPSTVASNVPFLIAVSAGAGNSVPTGTVTLTDGTATLGTAILDSRGNAAFSFATFSVGQHNLTATYAGDAQNTTSASGTLVQTVRLHVSTTVLTSSTTSTLTGQPIVLTATLSGDGPVPPSGSVVFTSGSTVLGTAVLNASGLNSQSSNPAGNTGTATLSLSGVKGSYGVVATYAGDSLYSGSASPAETITVADPPNFTITLSPNTMSLSSKQHSTLQITLTSLQGFSDTLALGCVGLPASATCTFSTDHSKLDANGNQVVQLTVDTGSPLVAGGAATARNSKPSIAPFSSTRARLCLLPGGFALLLLLMRSRRSRRMLPTLLALLVTAVSFAVSGCGTLDVNGTPAGQYTFNITAIGANTAITQSAPLQLKVTQ